MSFNTSVMGVGWGGLKYVSHALILFISFFINEKNVKKS